MAGGTDGNIISYDASGDPVAIATGDDGQVLTSAGAGQPPAFEAAAGGGAWTLIKTITASSDATISFVDGASDVVLDSTYDEYIFKFYNMHPETHNVSFSFNLSIDGGSNYNVTKTTTLFRAWHPEDDSTTSLDYKTGSDLAESTDFQILTGSVGDDNDSSCSGTLHLFDPSNTTFVKHFISNVQNMIGNGSSRQDFVAGYGNTTSAVDAIQFKFASGDIDSGKIKLFGIG
jgi:hypothetical protein